jgi:hypothetical protein
MNDVRAGSKRSSLWERKDARQNSSTLCPPIAVVVWLPLRSASPSVCAAPLTRVRCQRSCK